ncbi:MAG: Gfo/Idh/MocA family protein [Candidatus Binataceae bacterium]
MAPVIRSKTPRIGFLGSGWIGRMRMESLSRSGAAEISAIADPSPQARIEARAIAPQARILTHLADLLEQELDGIVISTPSASHAIQALAALEKGIAVFCQKPLGLTAAEARSVVDAARQANRALGVDFGYRLTAGMRLIRSLARSGELGKIYHLQLSFHNCYGPDKSWYYDRKLSGGGCLIDLGIHLIDLALWLMDFPPTRALSSSLFHDGREIAANDFVSIDDHALASIRLGEDAIANISCSWKRAIGQDAFFQVIVHGAAGAAEMCNVDGSFYDFRACHYHGRGRRVLCSPPDEWGGRGLIDWARRLGDGGVFTDDAMQFVRVAEVLDTLYGR